MVSDSANVFDFYYKTVKKENVSDAVSNNMLMFSSEIINENDRKYGTWFTKLLNESGDLKRLYIS